MITEKLPNHIILEKFGALSKKNLFGSRHKKWKISAQGRFKLIKILKQLIRKGT